MATKAEKRAEQAKRPLRMVGAGILCWRETVRRKHGEPLENPFPHILLLSPILLF
tara:strand:- start:206 stop:370 length:165 start_codon:yes stop_codon:yes gene_type:complete